MGWKRRKALATSNTISSWNRKGIYHMSARNEERTNQRLYNSFRSVPVTLYGAKHQELRSYMIFKDLTAHNTHVFSKVKAKKGTSFVLHIMQPRALKISCITRYCEQLNIGSIVLKKHPHELFRILLEFIFKTEEEQQAVKDMIQEIYDEDLPELKEKEEEK